MNRLQEQKDLERALCLRGFVFECTGGNCTAFVRYLENGDEVFITDSDWRGNAPESVEDVIFVTVVYRQEDDILDEVTLQTTMADFLENVPALEG